jgi:hypothetical protein
MELLVHSYSIAPWSESSLQRVHGVSQLSCREVSRGGNGCIAKVLTNKKIHRNAKARPFVLESRHKSDVIKEQMLKA